jgi:hypothetical protein
MSKYALHPEIYSGTITPENRTTDQNYIVQSPSTPFDGPLVLVDGRYPAFVSPRHIKFRVEEPLRREDKRILVPDYWLSDLPISTNLEISRKEKKEKRLEAALFYDNIHDASERHVPVIVVARDYSQSTAAFQRFHSSSPFGNQSYGSPLSVDGLVAQAYFIMDITQTLKDISEGKSGLTCADAVVSVQGLSFYRRAGRELGVHPEVMKQCLEGARPYFS